jgi:TldD protein
MEKRSSVEAHAQAQVQAQVQAQAHASRGDVAAWYALAQRGVEAATHAGAQYAEARLTRTNMHMYTFSGFENAKLGMDHEPIGVGVRALVHGYWGFAGSPTADADTIVRLAREAVEQAQANAKGPPRTVDLGRYPPAVGSWSTPITIDPFTVPVEEKTDYIEYWIDYAKQCGIGINTMRSWIRFARQERVTATSEGSRFDQTEYEAAGKIIVGGGMTGGAAISLRGLDPAARGWEFFMDADIAGQIKTIKDRFDAEVALTKGHRQALVGRYTIVCDGKAMAQLVRNTIGLATQLDRALGYEANASGTSFLTDPLGMLGQFQVTAPGITVTANRSAPAQLATVKWDDEGVVPEKFTLVKDGVLADFQTTREQAPWLAPYYQKKGMPIRSHGCAIAETGLHTTMQQMPNFALEPNPEAVRTEDLIASVKSGIFLEGSGDTGVFDPPGVKVDVQGRGGMLRGTMRKISNGRLGPRLVGGAVTFNTLELWKHVIAIGGAPARDTVGWSRYPIGSMYGFAFGHGKGQPLQLTSQSVTAVAATLTNQAIIDPNKKS